MRHYAGLFTALLACFAVPLAAQETRVGELDFQSPPASIDELGWLIGQWEGEGIEGAKVASSFLAIVSDFLVSVFIYFWYALVCLFVCCLLTPTAFIHSVEEVGWK